MHISTADAERAALRVEAAEGERERLRRQLKFLTEEEEVRCINISYMYMCK